MLNCWLSVHGTIVSIRAHEGFQARRNRLGKGAFRGFAKGEPRATQAHCGAFPGIKARSK